MKQIHTLNQTKDFNENIQVSNIYLNSMGQFAKKRKTISKNNNSINFHTSLLFLMIFQAIIVYIFYEITFCDDSPIEQGNSIQNQFRQITPQRNNPNQEPHTPDWQNYIALTIFYCIIVKITHQQSQIIKYFSSLKPMGDFSQEYKKLLAQPTQLKFQIDCYHMERNYRNDDQSQQKVVSFHNQSFIHFVQLHEQDSSCPATQKCPIDFKTISKHMVFIQFLPQYQLQSQQEQKFIQQSFQQFIRQNRRDERQQYGISFNFKNLTKNDRKSSYHVSGQPKLLKFLIELSCFLFLSWPASIFMELFFIERLNLILIKNIAIVVGNQNTTTKNQETQTEFIIFDGIKMQSSEIPNV